MHAPRPSAVTDARGASASPTAGGRVEPVRPTGGSQPAADERAVVVAGDEDHLAVRADAFPDRVQDRSAIASPASPGPPSARWRRRAGRGGRRRRRAEQRGERLRVAQDVALEARAEVQVGDDGVRTAARRQTGRTAIAGAGSGGGVAGLTRGRLAPLCPAGPGAMVGGVMIIADAPVCTPRAAAPRRAPRAARPSAPLTSLFRRRPSAAARADGPLPPIRRKERPCTAVPISRAASRGLAWVGDGGAWALLSADSVGAVRPRAPPRKGGGETTRSGARMPGAARGPVRGAAGAGRANGRVSDRS